LVVEGRETNSLPTNEGREVEVALESQWGSIRLATLAQDDSQAKTRNPGYPETTYDLRFTTYDSSGTGMGTVTVMRVGIRRT